jgi:hypothetical protein
MLAVAHSLQSWMWRGGAYSLAHLNLPDGSYVECLSRGELCTVALAGADVQTVGILDLPCIGPVIHAGSRQGHLTIPGCGACCTPLSTCLLLFRPPPSFILACAIICARRLPLPGRLPWPRTLLRKRFCPGASVRTWPASPHQPSPALP